jgi:predicted ATPase/DNA-binding NarL/FixJ family response regulator
MVWPQLEPSMSISVPTPLTSFVGREHEVEQICALLRRDDVRLLTLTGPGGVGKTRLALAAAMAVAGDFADGLRFVPLAAVRDHQLVASALLRAIGAREAGEQSFADQVRVTAPNTQALLVVDNFEHVLAAAPLLTELLAASPRLTLLVTSRERLRVSGERDVPVLPLACPDPERLPSPIQVAAAPAVRLFTERAQAVDPGFALTDANAAAVAAICHRLDGLPLALELAAARSPHLTPAVLLARLARRLPLLTGGPRDVPARLRTMRDAVTWSYDLLTLEEQALFRRVAVFAGGFTLEAAEAIAGSGKTEGWFSGPLQDCFSGSSALDGIASLVDKSLVRRIDQISHGPADWRETPRFEVLETIREFGLEQVVATADEDMVYSAHASYYLALAADTAARGSDDPAVFDQLEVEHANFRAALAWSCAHGSASVALRLAAQLGRFWLRRGHQLEGRAWLERVIALTPDGDPTLRSAALSADGELQRELGEHAESTRSFELALDLARSAGDWRGQAMALTGLSALADDVGDHAATRSFSEASAAIWRELGNIRELARAIHNLGLAEAGLGNGAAAPSLFHEALTYARAANDDRGIAHNLTSIGGFHVEQGEFEAAWPYMEEGLTVARAARDHSEIAAIAADLGWLALDLGAVASARGYFAECLALLRGSGRRRLAVFALEGCAVLASIEGRRELADHLVVATAAMRAEMGVPIEHDPRVIAPGPTSTRQVLRQVIAASSAGQVWSIDKAIREAETMVTTPQGSETAVSGDRDLAGRSGLSPREMEVLRLLVTGQSDHAIADTLFISRRTASKHVGAILAKLEATTRTEAAARAIRDGLA